jgi:methionine sulfoxide reductase heme-binding subunit
MAARSRWLWLLWPLGCVPFGVLLWQGISGALGPDPAKDFVAYLGWWALVLLIATLAVRPVAMTLRQPWLVAARRTLGLLAFAYASIHLVAWAWLLLGWDWGYIGSELNKRPYILVGFSAWLLLLPLALTSTRASRRKMGARWQKLHRLIFPAVLLGLIHDTWIQKSGYGEQLLFFVMLLALFGWRFKESQKRRKNSQK